MTKAICQFCGAAAGTPHDKSVDHGDPYRRVFNGDVAQCGCAWVRDGGWGDVLHECQIHAAATKARATGDP